MAIVPSSSGRRMYKCIKTLFSNIILHLLANFFTVWQPRHSNFYRPTLSVERCPSVCMSVIRTPACVETSKHLIQLSFNHRQAAPHNCGFSMPNITKVSERTPDGIVIPPPSCIRRPRYVVDIGTLPFATTYGTKK